METYIAHTNIDRYLDLLHSCEALAPANRSALTKLLIKEEDRLSHTLEQLQFAEDRTTNGRERVARLRELRDGLASGSAERAKADKMLETFEMTQQLMERFCEEMRQQIDKRAL